MKIISKIRHYSAIIAIISCSIIPFKPIEIVKASLDNETPSINEKYLENDFYILGAGDLLKLTIFASKEFSGEYSILNDGSVNFPLIGTIKVSNMTIKQASDLVFKKYGEHLLRPELHLSVVSARPIVVSVVGEVEMPGLYSLTNNEITSTSGGPSIKNSGLPTVVNAIQKAGGITQNANLNQVILKRKLPLEVSSYKQTSLNLISLLREGKQENNPFLFDGDIIKLVKVKEIPKEIIEIASGNLSPKTIKVNVIGQVDSPGSYELEANTPLMKAIMQAGGTKDWISNKKNIQLFRINRNGSATLKRYKWNLKYGVSSEMNPPLKNGDIVKVNPSSFAKLSSGLGVITQPMSDLVTAFTLFKLVED